MWQQQAGEWRIHSLRPITIHYTSMPVSSPIVIYSCPVIRPAWLQKKSRFVYPRCFFLIMSGIYPSENYSACSLHEPWDTGEVFSHDGEFSVCSLGETTIFLHYWNTIKHTFWSLSCRRIFKRFPWRYKHLQFSNCIFAFNCSPLLVILWNVLQIHRN